MKINYHTHTSLCGHAEGSMKEYVERAIKNGIEVLGFSDHAPHLYPYNNTITNVRMSADKAFEYVQSIKDLAREYKNDIKILLGFEMEYYPDFYNEDKAFLDTFNPDFKRFNEKESKTLNKVIIYLENEDALPSNPDANTLYVVGDEN